MPGTPGTNSKNKAQQGFEPEKCRGQSGDKPGTKRGQIRNLLDSEIFHSFLIKRPPFFLPVSLVLLPPCLVCWWPALGRAAAVPVGPGLLCWRPDPAQAVPVRAAPVLGGLAGPVAAALAWRRVAHIAGNGRDGGSPWRPTPRRAVRCLSGAQAAAVGCAACQPLAKPVRLIQLRRNKTNP